MRFHRPLRYGVWAGAVSVVVVLAAGVARADVRLNEIVINPAGADDNREYVELLATSATESLQNLWLIEIETDGAMARGTVDMARNLTGLAFGANRLLLLGQNYETALPPVYQPMVPAQTARANLNRPGAATIEQDVNLLIVRNFTGVVGVDYDVNDDGTLDQLPFESVIDSVALRDPTFPSYAGTPGVFRSDGTATVDAVARIVGDIAANSAASYFGGELVGDLTFSPTAGERTANFPTGYQLTPGAPNVVPEPAAFGLAAAMGAALTLARQRRRSLA